MYAERAYKNEDWYTGAMRKILLATTNPAKMLELQKAFAQLQNNEIELVTLRDLAILDDPEETGDTFVANARLKAEYYGNKTGLSTISDDGGLEIDILNGEPGVKSRRWPGYKATDAELIAFTLEKLKNVPAEKRTAKLTTCLYFYDPHTKTSAHEEECIYGSIATKPLKMESNGYPYRVLFIVAKYKKFYDELTDEEHTAINHRLIAAKRLSAKIVNILKD